MTWFLVVLFLGAEGFEIREGWYPRPQPDLQTCVQRVEEVIAYLNTTGVAAVASCQLVKTGVEI